MESLEEMQTRHRKEQRDLQARVTQKKKSATKKTRKGVNSECEALERQLKERQEQERAALDGDPVPDINDVPELDEPTNEEESESNGVSGVSDSLEQTTLSSATPSEDGQPRRRNRQKERLARRAAEQEVAIQEAKKEAANQPDQKAVERAKMLLEIKARV